MIFYGKIELSDIAPISKNTFPVFNINNVFSFSHQ